ncbi:DNA methylase [Mycobacterium phage KyMonks1A]|nr:DNA methylase [Mycobacterium phage KyMonks1A]
MTRSAHTAPVTPGPPLWTRPGGLMTPSPPLRLGSLCTGYAGLDRAVERVLGARMVWYSEIEKHPSRLLSQRFPGVPNVGDLTAVDWASLPPVNVLTAGYPCQPFSSSGKKLGVQDDRHLWPHIREAVRVLRPRLAVFENVVNHLRIGFDAVLRDCAEDGLSVRWVTVRASDVGAPHSRERLFFVVTDPSRPGLEGAFVQPRRQDAAGERSDQDPGTPGLIDWGDRIEAIRRWEQITGRSAPLPHEPSTTGFRPRVSAEFYEWLMGLPRGWVTDAGLPYGAQIKLLGNGVVPQQAEFALRQLLDLTRNERKTSTEILLDTHLTRNQTSG